ncbi:hypothetical protein WA158_006391 [Blastocystis sp. Blastoise]
MEEEIDRIMKDLQKVRAQYIQERQSMTPELCFSPVSSQSIVSQEGIDNSKSNEIEILKSRLQTIQNQYERILSEKDNQIKQLETRINENHTDSDSGYEVKYENTKVSEDNVGSSDLVQTSPQRYEKSHFNLSASIARGYHTKNGTKILNTPYSFSTMRFTWTMPPKSVLIIKKEHDQTAHNSLIDIACWLNSNGLNVYVEPAVFNTLPPNTFAKTWTVDTVSMLENTIDFVVTLGGDGTLLTINSLFLQSVPPVISFAMGTLGFLTPFDYKYYRDTLNNVISGGFYINIRSRLECKVVKNDDYLTLSPYDDTDSHGDNQYMKTFTVLNDIVLDRGSSSAMLDLECSIENKNLTSVHADGLIIATPTGSTAYSMAAGGSIVHPAVPAMLLTPICPHTLSFRQMILPDSVILKVLVNPSSRTNARISYDGRHQHVVKKGEAVYIRVSSYPLPSVCSLANNEDWYTNVNERLYWNKQLVRKEQLSIHQSSQNISYFNNNNNTLNNHGNNDESPSNLSFTTLPSEYSKSCEFGLSQNSTFSPSSSSSMHNTLGEEYMNEDIGMDITSIH